MKKVLIITIMAFVPLFVMAQKTVKVKSGTVIPLQSVIEVKAADVNEGDLVDFRVSSDVKSDGIVIVPQGTITKGRVIEAKKSSIAGTKGRLVIEITNVPLENGEKLYLSSTLVRVYGKNKTPLAVVTGCLVWPCIFIPGTKAVMPAGYEVQGIVSSNTEIELN